MFLLDTNVVSEFRKINIGKGDLRVKAWAQNVDAGMLFISVISVFELQVGTELMERRDKVQGAMLRSSLENQTLQAFDGRILPIDLAIARRAASLHVPNPRPYRDALIASTALVHRMTVVTRDTDHFAPMRASVLNPWHD